jgi:hypothetical protein
MKKLGKILMVATAGLVAFELLDSTFIKTTRAAGVVVEKRYKPAEETITAAGKFTSQEQYWLTVKVDGQQAEASVTKAIYEKTNQGTKVSISFGHGRLCQTQIHINDISLM